MKHKDNAIKEQSQAINGHENAIQSDLCCVTPWHVVSLRLLAILRVMVIPYPYPIHTLSVAYLSPIHKVLFCTCVRFRTAGRNILVFLQRNVFNVLKIRISNFVGVYPIYKVWIPYIYPIHRVHNLNSLQFSIFLKFLFLNFSFASFLFEELKSENNSHDFFNLKNIMPCR